MKLITIRHLETFFPFKMYSRTFPLKDLKYIEHDFVKDRLFFKFDKEVVSKKATYEQYLYLIDKLNKDDKNNIEV